MTAVAIPQAPPCPTWCDGHAEPIRPDGWIKRGASDPLKHCHGVTVNERDGDVRVSAERFAVCLPDEGLRVAAPWVMVNVSGELTADEAIAVADAIRKAAEHVRGATT